MLLHGFIFGWMRGTFVCVNSLSPCIKISGTFFIVYIKGTYIVSHILWCTIVWSTIYTITHWNIMELFTWGKCSCINLSTYMPCPTSTQAVLMETIYYFVKFQNLWMIYFKINIIQNVNKDLWENDQFSCWLKNVFGIK